MPLESSPAGEASGAPGIWQGDEARGHWWRPRSTAGRVFFSLTALLLVSAMAVSGYYLKTYLGRDGRFRIAGAGNIESKGLSEVSRAELLPVFGEDIGRNVFFVPIAERRQQLEKIPWVERATVMRLLPDHIRVEVVERKPIAFVRQGNNAVRLVDAAGVLLDMPASVMAERNYSFPVVTGIDPADPLPARTARMAVYQRLLHDLDAGGQRISEQLSEIDLTDPEDARVLMPEPGGDILAHFGSDQFLQRYQHYKDHIAEWRQQYPRLSSVDLRYERQVVLQMAQGGNVTQPKDGEQTASAQSTPVESKPAQEKKKLSGKPSAAKAGASAVSQPVSARSGKASQTSAKKAKDAKGKLSGSAKAAAAKAVNPRTAHTKSPSSKTIKAKTTQSSSAHLTVKQQAALEKERDRKRAQARHVALNRSRTVIATSQHAAVTAGAGQ
jgi:cell division protein FtsQ